MSLLTLFLKIISVLIGYLFGSINSAVIVSRIMYKDDVRRYGSGNAGTTNVSRIYGAIPGLLTLLGDFLKTAVAILIGAYLGDQWGKLAAFIGCFLGHCYPIFFRFKGGKGVSVCFCTMLMLDWRMFIIMLAVFVIVMLCTRIVSLSSLAATFVLIPSCFLLTPHSVQMILASIFAFFTVTFAHRTNIKRLINGEEPKFIFKK